MIPSATSPHTRPDRRGRVRQRQFQLAVMQIIAGMLHRQRPTIVAVAAELSMTVRTLQRRLADGGIAFRALLNECRRLQALEELTRGGRAVSEISTRLGYSDPAHFVRAFRRWTGRSPTEFARRRVAQRRRGYAPNGDA